jgi:hypothetical protein
MTTQTNQADEVLISGRQLAARWGTSTETVKRRQREGLLTPIRFNARLTRYKLSNILAIEAAAGGGEKAGPALPSLGTAFEDYER